jgi:thioredoxin 2
VSDLAECPGCGARNRLGAPPPGSVPRCGKCKAALPWLVTGSDASLRSDLDAATPVLVDFWAPWCGPCRVVAPTLEALAREWAGRLKVVKLNIDENPQTAAHYRVQSIPTLMLFRDGQPVETVVGALPRAALAQRLAPHVPGRQVRT